LNTIQWHGPKNVERRINIVNVRRMLKEYADTHGWDTDGVFATLPKGKY
jgi:hypothetical protein